MRRILPFLLLLVGCALQPITDPRRPNPEEEPTIVPTAISIEKPTYIVEQGSVSSQLFKSGRVTPVNQSQLSFQIDGTIAQLLFSKGDSVDAGEPVAILDTTPLEQALQAAESDLKVALEQLANAEDSKTTNLRRAEIGVELAQLQLDYATEQAGDSPTAEQALTLQVLQRELELAQLTFSELDRPLDPLLSNTVSQAEQQIDTIKRQIVQSTLTTPLSGTVMVVNIDEGDSITAGEAVLIVADLNQVEVEVPLVGREIQELSEGLAAVGVNPSRPETSFPMTIRQLPYPYGSGSQNNDDDDSVRVSFDRSPEVGELDVGDRIEITILLDEREGVLWLPPAAIREFNGRLFVVLQEGETQRRVDVKIGLQNDNQIEILSGVSEGQTVVGP